MSNSSMGEDVGRPLYPTSLVEPLLDYERGEKTPPPRGVQTTMARLLDEYTLHDSYWMSLNVEQFESDLLIRFDAYWSKGRIPHPGARVGKWPRLIITMSGLVETQLDFGAINYSSSIGGADSAEHPTRERKAVTRYQLDAGLVALVHDPIVELRMIDPEGNLITIPL